MTRTENIGINFDSFAGLPLDLYRRIKEAKRQKSTDDIYPAASSDAYVYITSCEIDNRSDR